MPVDPRTTAYCHIHEKIEPIRVVRETHGAGPHARNVRGYLSCGEAFSVVASNGNVRAINGSLG